jgi:hypothetical protein
MQFRGHESEEQISQALECLVRENRVQKGDDVVIVSSIAAGEQRVDAIQMRKIP